MEQVAAGAVPHFEVSSGSAGSDAAFAAFAQSVEDVFAIARTGTDDYRLELRAWHLGTLMLGSFDSSSLSFERAPALVARSGLDHLLVQLYEAGGFQGTAGEYPIEVAPGDIVVFDLASTLHTQASDFRNLSFLIPRAFFESHLDDPGALHGIVLRPDMPLAGILASYFRALVERVPALQADEAIAAAKATAALATTVLCTYAQADRRTSQPILSPFRAIAQTLEAGLHDPELDAEQVAARLGMSRATLYRVFEPVGGVAGYIRRRRLSRAALALAAPENARRKIAEISYENGFASEATFARIFRATFGLSPRAARERSAALWTLPQAAGGAPADPPEFARWMRTLRA
ncbi:helix-turn-helix domain-containing protein [Sphingosinicella sp. BN140058]|nr:helix-turn-helix domain-containing protein [Sphingosinicella sp. BN140058]